MIEIKNIVEASQDAELKKAMFDLNKAVTFRGNYISDLMMAMYDGEKDAVKKYFAQFDKSYKLLKLYKDNELFTKTVKKFEDIKAGYEIKEAEIQTVLNCIKVGEKQDTAIKKLVKLTKTLKSYSINKLAYSGTTFFSPMTEDDFLEEIKRFKGAVKMRAAMDFYVIFKDGKVESFYF